jgi:hypothetical protein
MAYFYPEEGSTQEFERLIDTDSNDIKESVQELNGIIRSRSKYIDLHKKTFALADNLNKLINARSATIEQKEKDMSIYANNIISELMIKSHSMLVRNNGVSGIMLLCVKAEYDKYGKALVQLINKKINIFGLKCIGAYCDDKNIVFLINFYNKVKRLDPRQLVDCNISTGDTLFMLAYPSYCKITCESGYLLSRLTALDMITADIPKMIYQDVKNSQFIVCDKYLTCNDTLFIRDVVFV